MVRTHWSKNALFATITAAGDPHLPTSFEWLANERDGDVNGCESYNSVQIRFWFRFGSDCDWWTGEFSYDHGLVTGGLVKICNLLIIFIVTGRLVKIYNLQLIIKV